MGEGASGFFLRKAARTGDDRGLCRAVSFRPLSGAVCPGQNLRFLSAIETPRNSPTAHPEKNLYPVLDEKDFEKDLRRALK